MSRTIGARVRTWIRSRLVPLIKGPKSDHVQQRNIWHLYQDLLWLGFASAASTYINVYAIRLGATKELLGLRASIPSLLMVLLRIPAARLIERTADRKRLIVRSLTASRLVYLLLFLLPWLAALPGLRQIPPATLLVVVVVTMGIPSILAAAGWDTFFADVVPVGERARVVSVRSMVTNLMMLTIVPVMGSLLEALRFPVNYQIIFLAAFVGAMASVWHVNQIHVAPAKVRAARSEPLNLRGAWQIMRGSRAFSVLLWGTFVYQWAISLASPLFSIYFIEDLGATESWIGWRATLASLISILAYRFWPRVIERHGERTVLLRTAPFMLLFPLLTGLTRSLTLQFLIVIIPRIFGAAVMLTRYSLLLRDSPPDRRPSYIAIYAILVNIAAFVAPLVGTSLSEYIGITGVFFASAALRLTAALIYHWLPEDPGSSTGEASPEPA
ncbi:MAG TPA: MFS transporter [Chloroflexi bacterium]|nr:MFS transporter [Chloroflexota bacterium]